MIFSLDEFDDSRREFETFFFSHVTLIEGQLAQLRAAVEKSACEPRDRVTSFIMEVGLITVVVSYQLGNSLSLLHNPASPSPYMPA